jgi:cytochrome c peroxidase
MPARDAEGQAAIARGEKLFASEKAACTTCHKSASFTDGEIHDLGLGSGRDRYKGYNTPTLLGTGRKVRWLHDGRARTLEDLLTGPHNPAKVAGSELTPDEVRDLAAYLKSL